MRDLIDMAGMAQIAIDGAKALMPAVRTRSRELADTEIETVVRLLEEKLLETDLLVGRLVELTAQYVDEFADDL